jgi:hypothetical protein
LINLGRHDEGQLQLRLALANAEASGDPERLRSVVNTLASLSIAGPTPVPELIAFCDQLFRSAAGDRVLEATLQRSLGVLYAMDARPKEAFEALALSGALLDEVRLRRLEVHRPLVAYARDLCGDRDGAVRELVMSWDYFRELGSAFDIRAWTAANRLASLYCDEGRFAEAAELHAYGRNERGGADPDALWLSVEARLVANEDRLEHAVDLARESARRAEEQAVFIEAAECIAAAAGVQRLAGRTTEADATAARALALFEGKGNLAGAARLRTAAFAAR